MKEYTGDRIRNVAIVGHGGAGTTSSTLHILEIAPERYSKASVTDVVPAPP